MTGLNEFKEWVAMERKSIECTIMVSWTLTDSS